MPYLLSCLAAAWFSAGHLLTELCLLGRDEWYIAAFSVSYVHNLSEITQIVRAPRSTNPDPQRYTELSRYTYDTSATPKTCTYHDEIYGAQIEKFLSINSRLYVDRASTVHSIQMC